MIQRSRNAGRMHWGLVGGVGVPFGGNETLVGGVGMLVGGFFYNS